MGFVVNICALLVGLAAFAGWTLSRFTVAPRAGWVNFFCGVGILALLFSIVSPDDDGLQQALIRSAVPSVRVSAHTRVAPRRLPAGLSITAIPEARDSIGVPGKRFSFVVDHRRDLDTHFHASIPIHSPPVAT